VLAGNGQEAAEILKDYKTPDPTFDEEYRLLYRLSTLLQASDVLAKGQSVYAAQLLEEMGTLQDGYCAEHLERQRLLLLAKARPQLRKEICRKLPPMDEELLLRARDALDRGEFDRSACYLEAVENQESADRNFLMGELHLVRKQYAVAAEFYHKAEESYPEKCAVRLEHCYRELEDFRKAYYYACKQR
jgi:hypothetical protein